MATNQNILATKFHFASLLRYAAPTIGMMVFMGLYTIVDTIFVSRFVNTDALSAINICTPVLYTVVGLAGMLATGASAIIGRKMGEGDNAGARQTFSFIIAIGALVSVALLAAGIIFSKDILRFLGASDTLMPYCEDYLRIQLLFIPANILGVLFQNLFIVAGRPRLGLALSLVAGLANIILDYVFIVVLHMGILGASLGTALGYLFPAVGGLLFFSGRRSTLYFSRPRSQWKELGQSLVNGSSEMVSQLSTAVTTFSFNITMMRIAGESGVAAITVIIYSQFLLQTLFMGFSMGVAPVFSYHRGDGDIPQLRRVFRICIGVISLFSVLVFVLSMLLGPAVAGVFDPDGTEVFLLARDGFRIFPFAFLFCGFNIFSSALFTALENGKVSAAISFLRTLGFLLLFLLALPKAMGITGAWLAVPLAELCAFTVALLFLFANRKRYRYF